MRIGLVREAGGFGDIINLGAPAKQLKFENPNCYIVVFCPDEFVDLVAHLSCVDEVVSLGTLKDLRQVRRPRGSELDIDKYPYLAVIKEFSLDKVVDLFGVGYIHESTLLEPCTYSRSELFSIAAGCRYLDDSFAHFLFSGEEYKASQKFLSDKYRGRDFIGVSLRGTCKARCYPYKKELVEEILKRGYDVIYFDGIEPDFELPEGAWRSPKNFLDSAELVQFMEKMIVVDSAMLHVAAMNGFPTLCLAGPTDGRAITHSYKYVGYMNGVSDKCKEACQYNPKRGWNPECKENGCKRMDSLRPEVVCEILFN